MGIFRRGAGGNIKFNCETDFVMVKDTFKNVWKNWLQTGLIVKPATITVTTSTLSGQPVTCQIGDESYTSTFVDGKAVFKVFTAGTVSISSMGYYTTVDVVTGVNYIASVDEILQLVLWENGVAQNGASLISANRLDYDCYLSGAFKNKTINMLFKTTAACEPFLGFLDGVNGSNLGVTCCLKNDGSFVIAPEATGQTHVVDQIYTHHIADIAAKVGQSIDKLHALIFHMKDGSGNNVAIANYVSKIWIE